MKPGQRSRVLFAVLFAVFMLHVGVARAVAGPGGAVTYLVYLDGAQERPTPVATPATGNGNIEVDTDANTIKVKVSYSNLSAAETAAHIHGPTPIGVDPRSVAVGVLFGLPAGQVKVTTINYSGHAMPDSVDAWLLTGRTYLNIHSASHGSGEIRGQIDNNQPSTPGGVPSLGTWGAALLALALLAAAAVWVTRRRAQASNMA